MEVVLVAEVVVQAHNLEVLGVQPNLILQVEVVLVVLLGELELLVLHILQ